MVRVHLKVVVLLHYLIFYLEKQVVNKISVSIPIFVCKVVLVHVSDSVSSIAAVLMDLKRRGERASRVVDEILLLQVMQLSDFYSIYGDQTLRDLRRNLKYMTTFLLFVRNWHNDVRSRADENTSSSSNSLGFFLNSLFDSLIQNGVIFYRRFLAQTIDSLDNLRRSGAFEAADEFNKCIYSFKQEIAQSYVTLSDYYIFQSREQLLEVIDSLQVIVADKRSDEGLYFVSKGSIEVESLLEMLVFAKNFIRFAQLRGFEPRQLQFLFTHLQVAVVNAARLYHNWIYFPPYGSEENKFPVSFDELFLKIKPVDSQIRENYVQVLMALKFSGSSHSLALRADRHVLGDFVDSLLYNILEALNYRISSIVSMNDQVPILYEGLKFLRTILTNHLEKIDQLHEKVKDLIGAAVNEAVFVICSLPVYELEEGLAKEMDFSLLNFLEKIKLIKVITSAFIFPRTSEHGFVDFFLENLKELPSCKVYSIVDARDQIHTVQEDLASLRLSFRESVLDQHNQDGKLQSLWNRVVEVTHKTRFVIESLVVGDIPDCSALEFNHIKEEINLIKMEALRVNDNQCGSETENVTETSSSSPSQGSAPTINKAEGTLDDEAKKIIEQLTSGSKQLDIISIVGMPGIGKTTLARSVYDDPSVRGLFHVRAWCVISQVYKKTDLLLQILRSVAPDISYDYYSRWNECQLEEKLKKCLLRNKYLIVLDDVWDTDSWIGLERSFPDDANSSRILLTSRDSDVAKKINPTREPYPLRLLSVEESWHLLQKKLSCRKSYPLNLAKKIAKNCKGLPLTIVIVAGILATLEQNGWVQIAERLSLSDLPIIDQCKDMLEVSYKMLPENLRSCLLYFGAFQEDEEIPCRKLMLLWMAEGFVQTCEDVARDYMNDLIGRNWVMVSKERFIGGAKTCLIHDLLREFCVVKAREEKFLSILSGHDELFNFHGQRNLQRLCIHSTSKDFEKSRLFCPSLRSFLFADNNPGIAPKICTISFIFQFCKLLRVLDLRNISTFLSEITLLVELRYLAIGGDKVCIPPEIANLSNLETLIISWANTFSRPTSIWNLPKLRVLKSSVCIWLDSCLMSNSLHNLDTVSRMRVSLGQLEEVIRKLPNVRRLNCEPFDKSEEFNADSKSIVAMDCLRRLESLRLELCFVRKMEIGFSFPLNLKKLTLSRSRSSIIPTGGELPNLVVLKLHYISFEGDAWDMNEEWEFHKLKYLEILGLEIVRWTRFDGVDHFPCLEKLVVRYCEKLEEVPSCLGEIPNLQVIEVRCHEKLATRLFQKIKAEQKNDWGNDIQVLIEDSRGMIHQLASSSEITNDDEE